MIKHSGAMDMLTLRANQRAFMDWALLPRACRSKKASVTVDARTQMFGRSIRSPVCAAATGMQPHHTLPQAMVLLTTGTLSPGSSHSTTPTT